MDLQKSNKTHHSRAGNGSMECTKVVTRCRVSVSSSSGITSEASSHFRRLKIQ